LNTVRQETPNSRAISLIGIGEFRPDSHGVVRRVRFGV